MKQARFLADEGDFICLIPKEKDENGKNIPGPDAIRNGVLYEFKTVGTLEKAEARFRESRRPEHI